jgi:TRAP-type mannitol/chloroaromatic compound transport system permease large subunit
MGGSKFVLSLVDILPGGSWGVFIVTMLIVFVLGMFIDTTSICCICAPIVAPMILAAGFNPLWYAVIFNINLQCAVLSPPFGFSLFYLKSTLDESTPLKEVYWSAIPFICCQMLCLVLCAIFPGFALYGANIFMK